MRPRLGRGGNAVQGPSSGEKPEGLRSVAVPADGLEVRVLESGAAHGDLDDMVDVQLARPSAAVADLAGVAVPEHDVRTCRIPEVVSVELPLAPSRAVRGPVIRKLRVAFNASPGSACLSAPAGAVGEPRRGERNDPTVRSDHDRCGRCGPRHLGRTRRTDSIGFPCTGNGPDGERGAAYGPLLGPPQVRFMRPPLRGADVVPPRRVDRTARRLPP